MINALCQLSKDCKWSATEEVKLSLLFLSVQLSHPDTDSNIYVHHIDFRLSASFEIQIEKKPT